MNKEPLKWLVSTTFFAIVNFAFAENNLAPNDIPFSIEEATITSIHTAIKNHNITCEQLINIYLDRIKKYNLGSSKVAPINSLTEINPNVVDQARQLDQLFFHTQQFSGSLHCVPIVVKDNIDTYDSTTSAGTLALLGNQASHDAFLVSKLRQAGALILGKGSMDELGAGMSGISSRSGRIGNAFDSRKNSGGSSGGSAAAVSANFTMIGIGTDNSGSVRIPAAFNGIVGLRPGTGLISQTGLFPAGNLDGTAGPLARNVEDLARVLDVISKEDPNDGKTVQIPRVTSYTAYLNKNGLNGKRIGIVRHVGKVNTFKAMPEDITQIFIGALKTLEQSGAEIIDNVNLPLFNNNRDSNMAGMKQDVDTYLASYPSGRKNFQDICNSDRTRVFGNAKKCIKFIQSMPVKFGGDYKKALEIFKKNKAYVEGIMNQRKVDALLIPISTVGAATYDPYQVNTWLAPVSSNSGLPAITINLGYTQPDKMPIGMELIGRQFAEGTLIEMAYAHEKNSPPRRTPTMPEPNAMLDKLDIPAYNNVLTNIGYKSFINVLKKSKSRQPSEDLSLDVFSAIVNQELYDKN